MVRNSGAAELVASDPEVAIKVAIKMKLFEILM